MLQTKSCMRVHPLKTLWSRCVHFDRTCLLVLAKDTFTSMVQLHGIGFNYLDGVRRRPFIWKIEQSNSSHTPVAFRKVAPDEPDDLELMEDEDLEDLQTNNPRRSAQHQRAFSRQFDPCTSLSSRCANTLSSETDGQCQIPSPRYRDKSRYLAVLLRSGQADPVFHNAIQGPWLLALQKRPRRNAQLLLACPASQKESALVLAKKQSSALTRPCHVQIRTTLVLKADPGGSLPVTYINSLNISVPLCIDSLSRYLKIYGFAPHLVSRSGLKLLQEKCLLQVHFIV